MKKHYFWLDLMRFAASFFVLIHHVRGLFFPEWSSLSAGERNPLLFVFYLISRLGHEAVIVFFVLSGFLVGGNLLEKIMKNKEFSGVKFAIDRGVRVGLPLIGVLLFLHVTDRIFGYDRPFFIYLGNLFSLQGIAVEPASGPFWTLNYEVWFYCLCGAVGLLLLSQNNSFGRGIACICLLTATLILFSFLRTPLLLIFGIGVLCKFLCIPKRSAYVAIGSFLALLAFICLSQLSKSTRAFTGLSGQFHDIGIFGLAAAAGVFMRSISLREPSSSFSMGVEKFGTLLAAFSYTLYLCHFQVLLILKQEFHWFWPSLTPAAWCGFIGGVFICIAVSYLLYLLFEKHTQVVKNFFYRLCGISGTARETPPSNRQKDDPPAV